MNQLFWFLSHFYHSFFGIPKVCRFEPTCSQYAATCVREHGLGKGALLAVKRLLRCRPHGDFGWDPVPQSGNAKPALQCGTQAQSSQLVGQRTKIE